MTTKEEFNLKLEPGQQFNGATYLREGEIKTYSDGSKRRIVICRCSCGKEFSILLRTLLISRKHICRECLRKQSIKVGRQLYGAEIKLERGQRFGKLTYIRDCVAKGRANHLLFRYVQCRCDCGAIVEISARSLVKPTFHSCRDCFFKKISLPPNDFRNSHPRLWDIYNSMIYRCHFAKKGRAFKSYRARGITVCEEWRNSFKSFVVWALSHGYDTSLSIDRIDVNGNYEPSNCRWADAKIQANNQRPKRSKIYSFIHGEKLDLKTASERYHIPYQRIYERYKKGYRGDVLVRHHLPLCSKPGILTRC